MGPEGLRLMPEGGFGMDKRCCSCVKAAKGPGGVKCRALVEQVGERANCWAYSADPGFWKKYRKAVDAYRQSHSAGPGSARVLGA